MPAFSRFMRYFLAVGRQGSIRKAADELNISASAIDRQILQVEANIGVPLFERLPTGLRLTAAGEIMMAAGGRWEKGLDHVLAQIEDLRGLKRGHVEIAVIDALAIGFVPRIIHQIRQDYPGISIGVKVLGNRQVREAIAKGEADFGIFLEPQSFRDLTVRAYVDVVLGFIGPAGSSFTEQEECRFAASVGRNLVVPAEPLAVCEQVMALEAATDITVIKTAVCDNIQMIKSLVKEGVGIGILTSIDVISEVQEGQLAFTRISDPILRPMTLALCTASARSLSYASGVVMAEIENSFSQLGALCPAQQTGN